MEAEKCSVDDEVRLPIEIVTIIFMNLNIKEIYKSRRVCKVWRDAADLLIRDERFWRKHYEKDYGSLYPQARRKSALTYEGLCKSISLWSQIKSAKVSATNFYTTKHLVTFEIVNKNVIGVAACNACTEIANMFCPGSDHVLYIDLETKRELEIFHCKPDCFQEYRENEQVKANLERDIYTFKLSVESEKECFYPIETSHNYKRLFVHENSVYHTDPTDENIWRVWRDGFYMYKEIICPLSNGIIPLYFSHSENSVNFISSTNAIYALKDKSYEFREFLEPDPLHKLRKYNFYNSAFRLAPSLKTKRGKFLIYGDVILFGSSTGQISIFYVPFANGPFDIHKTLPNVVLNLKEMMQFSQRARIICMDVIEVENGHDIIVMTEGDIVKISFRHGFKEEEESECDTSSLPKKKRISESVVHKSHV